MFDKKIKIWVNRIPITLTNEEVKDLFLETADKVVLIKRFANLTRRLELANAKLKQYGHRTDF